MTLSPGKATLLSPAPVAVHDTRDMDGHAMGIEAFKIHDLTVSL
jgi:hypothetical protein